MSLILDGILLTVIIISIISGIKRGFIKTIMSFVSIIVAIFCGWMFTPQLAEYYNEHIFLRQMSESVENAINSLLNNGLETVNLSSLFTEKPQAFVDITDRYSADISSLESYYQLQLSNGEENLTEKLSLHIAEPLADILSSALAFLTIFIAVILVLKILTIILNTLFSLPGLNFINRFCGLLLGGICGLLYAFVLSYIFSMAVPALASIFPDIIAADAAQKSVLIELFEKYNIFTLFI